MSPALVDRLLEESDGDSVLRIGRKKEFNPEGSSGPTMVEGKGWALPAGAYTPRQIVRANAPLLEVVLHHLGPNPRGMPSTREMLLDNLASNLASNTRESTITIPVKDPGRVEMAEQAVKIGQVLINYAFNESEVPFDPGYLVRSPCEGHLLKPHVSQLMFGPRSLAHLMQVYNEYLHQMVLLRDALLPFENFEDVVIPIGAEPGRKRGMRHIEETRAKFLMEMMTKSITQASVITSAHFLLAPHLPRDNIYGFQYKYGVILPSFFGEGSSLRLLRYFPVIIDEVEESVAFENEYQDYYTAKQTEVSGGKTPKDTLSDKVNTKLQASLIPVPTEKSAVRQLQFALVSGERTPVNIDAGQIAKGRRYAYAVHAPETSSNNSDTDDVSVYSAWKILTETGPGLVKASRGTHLVRTHSNLELLALLGKLYPENVIVLKPGQSVEQAQGAGIGRVGRLVVQAPEKEASIMPK